MFDVSLYGHLTFDRIFDGFKKDTSVGSMGNVWKYITKIDPSLSINLQPTEIGEALILLNKKTSERSSIANLSMICKEPELLDSRWNHILYINELQDTSFIQNIRGGIVSADICRGNILKDLEVLRNIDFLFISDEDLFIDIKELYRRVRIGVVYHTSTGSKIYMNDGTIIETKVKKIIHNVNVLGAGDMLVSSFITERIRGNTNRNSIKIAHDTVSNLLEERK